MSSFRALFEVIGERGLFCSLYADRASHYWHTPEAGGKVDKDNVPTQVGRALQRLGIELIPAYSPEARGRSERMFGTLQKRLPQELRLAGITGIDEANRFLKEVYLPQHNARFALPGRGSRQGSASLRPLRRRARRYPLRPGCRASGRAARAVLPSMPTGLAHARGRRQGGQGQADPGRARERLGIELIPAIRPKPVRAHVRHLAEAPAPGTPAPASPGSTANRQGGLSAPTQRPLRAPGRGRRLGLRPLRPRSTISSASRRSAPS